MGRKVEGREGLGEEKKRGGTGGERSESGGGGGVEPCEASDTGEGAAWLPWTVRASPEEGGEVTRRRGSDTAGKWREWTGGRGGEWKGGAGSHINSSGHLAKWEDLLEKEMATHSSTLAWRIPRTEEPGSLQPMGSPRFGHD